MCHQKNSILPFFNIIPTLLGVRHNALVLLLLLLLPRFVIPKLDERKIDVTEVKNWALRFGKIIQQLSSEVTCLRAIRENFNNSGAEVEWVDGTQMLEEMRSDVQNMLAWKKQAVERISQVAEHAAKGHQYDQHLKHDFYNAKMLYDPRFEGRPEDDEEQKWKAVELIANRNYDGVSVNIMHSSIHVPTNVYDQAPDILNAIKWSEYLNPTFRNNMAVDPSLSWQFFGSSTGFMRLYPARKWQTGDGANLFDCRLRPWFIEAAASAKDIVILMDGSGSMTGLRKAIARDVAVNILETLTDNDFVTVLRFSEAIESIVPCFDGTLVQANEDNKREIRDHIDKFLTANIANFTLGLRTAFELLQKFHRSEQGSQCNQAIMLITDGAPYNYEEIFRLYNWPNIPVRVFTYLIGREVTDIGEVNWMACANRGYYTHVANLAEVREQVQKYIPVMSRPIVLTGVHPYIWTPVYADISDVQLTNWVWEERERSLLQAFLEKRAKRDTAENGEGDSMMEGNHTNGVMSDAEQLEFGRRGYKKKETPGADIVTETLHLMTTVATPVFDKRNYSSRAANLLGVAGTDVPIREILKLTPSYKLGVNGYAFYITNNGYLMYHPDLRPLFQDLLRPGYRNVDLTEVELVNDTRPAREFDPTLQGIRETMINRKIGWKALPVKIHVDGMRRVVTRNNSYFYGPIEGTPFSLGVVLPGDYGRYVVTGQKEVKRKEEDWMHYFKGNNWKVHPDWVYCDIPRKDSDPVLSPEDVIRNFLKEALNQQNFRWRTSSVRPPIFDKPVCERDLVQSLVFDAIATYVEDKMCDAQKFGPAAEDKMIKRYGIATTFVATRSGLMRFQDHRGEEERSNTTERPFQDIHTRATEELFYRRAVDFHQINNSAFVFSVPFDAGGRNNSLVTGSHAIFLGTGKNQAPAAVVGLQFMHSSFAEEFFNATSKCMQNCQYKCTDEELDCFLLDNNGFVIVSERNDHTGQFFGEIDFMLFDSMVQYGIYRRIHMFDYQAICLDQVMVSGPASILSNPIDFIRNAVSWMWTKMSLLMIQYSVYNMWSSHNVECSDDYYDGAEYPVFEDELLPNRTRARPCDREFDLYEMQPRQTEDPVKVYLHMCHSNGCGKQFIVHQVPYTNLVMLVVNKLCDCETSNQDLSAREVQYNETLRCLRLRSSLYRQKPVHCTHYHPEEMEIRQCGGGHRTASCCICWIVSLLLLLMLQRRS